MRRLDILVLGLNYAPETTGIAPYTRGMAQMLAGQGHDVHVVTGHPHYPQWQIAEGYGGWRSEERDGAVRVTRVRHPVPRHPTGVGRIYMEAMFAMATLTVRRRRPDLVIAVSPALLTVGAALRWRVGRRLSGLGLRRTAVGVVVQDVYSTVVAETGVLNGRGGAIVARLERELLSRADGVAAVHDVFRAGLARSAVHPSAISVIRNWTHTAAPTGDPRAMRETLGWPADHTVALHAGNMGAKQGLENVVEAARLAEARELPITFVLMGDGNQRRRLVELGESCTHVRFVDPLPDGDFETALAAADVLVLNERPSVAEMCVPSKLTSYFAAGRPVVAATAPTSPAAREVRAADAGIVIDPGCPELLLEAATALGMTDEEGAELLGQRGRAYAAMSCSSQSAQVSYAAWVMALAAGGCSVPDAPPARPPSWPMSASPRSGRPSWRRRQSA